MKTRQLGISALLSLLTVVLNPLSANDFHPQFPLLDAQGEKVIESREPLSTLKTCGACHDTKYIQAHSDHADAGASQIGKAKTLHSWDLGPGYFGAWNPLDYDRVMNSATNKADVSKWLQRYGARHVGGGPAANMVEMDCLLCHSNVTDNDLRNELLGEANFAWANSAPLLGINVLEHMDGQWLWNPAAFNDDGSVVEGLLDINKPKDENCAQCHGFISNELDDPLVLDGNPLQDGMTMRTGQIISPQRISQSGLNIKDKDTLSHAFDVHSDRVLGCVNCHYSLNNPVYFQRNDKNQPDHLIFDPRRLTSSDYLKRPLHQFAKGNSSHGLASPVSENTLRRCESCHQAEKVHNWLPYKTRHFSALACESCHIPELYGPTLQSIDWSMLDSNAQPSRQYRNSTGEAYSSSSMLSAFVPILLPRENVGGKTKLAPYNLITSWYWTQGDPSLPVSRKQLENALFQKNSDRGIYRDTILMALDKNSDNQLNADELRLDSKEKTQAVKSALESSGLSNVSLRGEVSAFSISHNVVNGQWATKDCRACHNKDSRVDAVLPLSDYQVGGLKPVPIDTGLAFSGSIQKAKNGKLSFAANAAKSGFYIIGRDGLGIVDIIGLLMFFGVALGVSAHATARYVANRRRGPTEHHYHREYIYDAYERLWHWLQAGSIIILLATGLIIHKPHIFGIFNFPYIVHVHNIVGFILLINAALALFYNLASGEIRQYLPEPKGFIGRTIAQATYYSKGIFEGKPHPLEKSREHKMNPLQQVTYLAILNVLLPAQIITGLLIWGSQRWPELTLMLGGLPVLAPIHTFVAWAFATFIVMHVYLTTTGHTPTGGIQAMIEGWDEVEDTPGSES